MRKHRKHAHVNCRKMSTPSVAIYTLILLMLAATVWYNNHQSSVLGTQIGGESGTQGGSQIGGGEAPTSGQLIPTIVQVTTTLPTSAPLPTNGVLPTSVPIPTPTLIVPSDPVYVEIIDTPGGGGTIGGVGGGTGSTGGSKVDIGADPVTVVIENTPGGVMTTTERLTPQTTVVESTSTVITAQTGQSATAAQQNPSTLDRLLAFFTGNSANPSDSLVGVATPKAPVYSQIYLSSVSGATFTTDPTETISALNLWLGFNGITLKSLGDGSFSITQGDVVAIIKPKDHKIAVNLARMELLVNTEAGFQPLSYLPARVTTYLVDSGIISKLSEPIKVVETPTELLLQMQTTSTQHLLAIIPVPIRVEYCMSATTLNPCGKKQGLLSKTLDFLSL